MNKTHVEVIESTDARLVEALTQRVDDLKNLVHPDLIHTNEVGQLFQGMKRLPVHDQETFQIYTIDVQERNITLFNNVAVVHTLEQRTGIYHGMLFKGLYRLTRVWKFNSRNWQLITSTMVQI